jgi:hypothetical protein
MTTCNKEGRGPSSSACRVTEDVVRLVERINPILAGQPSVIQGAALADLLAIWLAGHVYEGLPSTTATMREALLLAHVEHVRALVSVNARMMGTSGKPPR